MIVDAVISEYEKTEQDFYYCSDSDSEEGAKILKMLENSAEPDVLMAQMNASFSSYRSKLEVSKQNHLEKLIENALRNSGITEREVTPFTRVRVVRLNRRDYPGEHSCDEGFITIWEPTDRSGMNDQHDVVEGKAYAISSLIPAYSNSDTLYLHANGSTAKWRPLSSLEFESFRPFFNPRRNTLLSHLGEIPFSSEFDMAAFVLYVGEVHECTQKKQQWVFVTDGTKNYLHRSESGISVLAISFTSPCSNDLTLAPINNNLVGSTVAEAGENSIYFLNFDASYCKHLKGAAMSVQKWGSMSELAIKKLRERVSIIIGEGRS